MPENKNDKIEAQKSDDEEFTLESRPSIDLTPENAVFTLSPGGLVSMTLKNGEEEEFFERVMLLRAFPITNPQEFVSVRVPPKIKTEKPKEIGMIRRLSDFDEKTNEVFRAELDRRYFVPEITAVHSIKEKFSIYYWDVETTAGNIVFMMNDPFNRIRTLDDGGLSLSDVDGTVYIIPDPQKLDKASYRRIEAYL